MDTKITDLDEGVAISLLDWLVAVDVSFTAGAGNMGAAGTDVKWKIQTLVDFLKTHLVPMYQGIRAETADYTPQLNDVSYIVTMDSATDVDFNLPETATVAFPIGSWLEIIQLGAGHVLFVPEGGIASYQTRLQGSRVKAQVVATDTWHLSGDLEAV